MKTVLQTINRDFKIVVQRSNCSGIARERRLIGRSGFISLVGEELAVRLLTRAYNQKTNKITLKLRRGLTFILYSK